MPARTFAFVGTYTGGKSEGIYAYRVDPSDGTFALAAVAKGIANPSFVALHPRGTHLYAVAEVADFNGKNAGAVAAYAIDSQTGELTPLNRRSTVGVGPCHLSVDAEGKYVFVANYGGGSVAALPIEADGSLGEATGFRQHEGSSVNASRQKEPHAHAIMVDPSNRRVYAPDLGLDKILIYRIDGGKLTPNDPPHGSTHPGAGPRHFAFHPSAPCAYVINELDSTVTAFELDAATGALREIHHLSTLPDGWEGTSYCADIHLTPDGRFLYGSNRGHDSLAIFAVDPGTGRLTPIGHEPTGGKWPRNFAIDPAGTYLYAANQNSDSIAQFRIDRATGHLTPTGHVVEVGAPVCVKFLSVG